MAKKEITVQFKLQAPGGTATPAPPIGPALGQHGVNPGQFIQQFNAMRAHLKGKVIGVPRHGLQGPHVRHRAEEPARQRPAEGSRQGREGQRRAEQEQDRQSHDGPVQGHRQGEGQGPQRLRRRPRRPHHRRARRGRWGSRSKDKTLSPKRLCHFSAKSHRNSKAAPRPVTVGASPSFSPKERLGACLKSSTRSKRYKKAAEKAITTPVDIDQAVDAVKAFPADQVRPVGRADLLPRHRRQAGGPDDPRVAVAAARRRQDQARHRVLPGSLVDRRHRRRRDQGRRAGAGRRRSRRTTSPISTSPSRRRT